jgi:hypothetical protein
MELIVQHELDLQAWVARQKHRKPRRQVESTGDRRTQPHQTSGRIALFADRRLHFVGCLQQLPCMYQQVLTVACQAEVTGCPMEQAGPEMLLELRHLAGYR